jgi:oligoribonuclease
MTIAWIDIETTGLEPKDHLILELALIITDTRLEVLDERSWIIKPTQADDPLSKMNEWVVKTHSESGLLQLIEAGVPVAEVEAEVAEIVQKHTGKYKPTLAGSSPHFDRGFLKVHMPKLDEALHYRHFDTSVLESAFRMWRSDLAQPRDGRSVAHRALDDIRWSVDCARYYRGVLQGL